MSAYGYEFSLLVLLSRILSSRVIRCYLSSSWTVEDKIRILARACNILYLLHVDFKIVILQRKNISKL